ARGEPQEPSTPLRVAVRQATQHALESVSRLGVLISGEQDPGRAPVGEVPGPGPFGIRGSGRKQHFLVPLARPREVAEGVVAVTQPRESVTSLTVVLPVVLEEALEGAGGGRAVARSIVKLARAPERPHPGVCLFFVGGPGRG